MAKATLLKTLGLAAVFATAFTGCKNDPAIDANDEAAAKQKIETAGYTYKGALGKYFNPDSRNFDSYAATDNKDSSKVIFVIANWDNGAIVDIKPMNPKLNTQPTTVKR